MILKKPCFVFISLKHTRPYSRPKMDYGQNQQNILQISTMKRWGVNKTLQNMNHIMDSEQEFESAVEQI